MGAFRFRYVDLLAEPYGEQYFKPIGYALFYGVERFPAYRSWRADVARYLAFADAYIAQAAARDPDVFTDENCPKDYMVCLDFLEASRKTWPAIDAKLADLTFTADHPLRDRARYLMAAIMLRQCERCIAAARAGDVLAVGFLMHDVESFLCDDAIANESASAYYEVWSRAHNAAWQSHASHRTNKQMAQDWFAEHKTMTKDAAAQRMHDDKYIAASFRTIRGYLTGQ